MQLEESSALLQGCIAYLAVGIGDLPYAPHEGIYMKIHLNDVFIREVAVSGTRAKVYHDTELMGFGLQVTNKGSKSFVITYRDASGRQRQEKISEPGLITTTAARTTAFSRLELIKAEKDKLGLRTRAVKTCPTVSSYFYGTYLPVVRMNIATHETTAANFRNHIEPILGRYRLDEVGIEEVASFVEHLRKKEVWAGKFKKTAGRKLSERSIERIIINLRHIFSQAIDAEKYPIRKNPVRHVKIDHEKTLKGRFLSPEELQALARAASGSKNKSLFNMIKVIAGTGLRKSNVTHMRWDWVKFDTAEVAIPKDCDKVGKGFKIALAAPVLELLRSMHSCRTQDEWVFPSPVTGKPYACIRESWLVACKRAGLGLVRVHDLRHSFASIMLESGASLEDVRVALNHSNIATTTIYLHTTTARQSEMANAAVNRMGVF